jgi:UDP-N-acetylmuramoyl-tripeptide--D-alanyl-D-alanine ligase
VSRGPAEVVAERLGGRVVAGEGVHTRPGRLVIDSREVREGDLFVGIAGETQDGGAFAPGAMELGAWGVVVTPEHSGAAAASAHGGVVIEVEDPVPALGRLASAYLGDLRDDGDLKVVAVTGSTGKTSTKDILAAILERQVPTHANRENLNTEIGLPLTVLEADPGTRAMVLEMAMRGEGQIAELTAIAQPDVGVIVNVGPVHLELLGTVEAVAAAKAELIRDLEPGSTAVVPAGERLLDPHLRGDLDVVTFGTGGDVSLASFEDGVARFDARGEEIVLELGFDEPHNLANTEAAVAAAQAIGITPSGRIAPRFSSLRGDIVEIEGDVTVVNDCYNANPMSMRAALEHLATSADKRSIAILGGMAELGPEEARYHEQVGGLADRLGINVLVTVGDLALGYRAGFTGEIHSVGTPEEAGALLGELAGPGDRVLIKGSRSVGLERVLGV